MQSHLSAIDLIASRTLTEGADQVSRKLIKVLLVDDNAAFRSSLRNLLTSLNICVVATAESGDEAVLLATSTDVDLILMDVNMPGCDGPTALRKIKKRRPDLRVVMLSSDDDQSVVARCLQLGASAYLNKSFRIGEFSDAIEAIIGQPTRSEQRRTNWTR